MSHSTTLNALKGFLSLYESRKQNDDLIIKILLSQEEIKRIEVMQEKGVLFDSFSIESLSIGVEDLSFYIGSEADVVLSLSSLRSCGLYIFKDWEDLLEYKQNLITVPESFLVISDGAIYPEQEESGKVKHYVDIVKLIGLLKKHSDHQVQLTEDIIEELVFLHKSRLEIKVRVFPECLGEGLDGISVIEGVFSEKSHEEQKSSILKETLYSFLINHPVEERLHFLISNFGEFSKRLNENYQLFVSDFSFDEVRKEYEEKKREYLSSINDAFSSVQTKMLGVPLILAVAALRMSSTVDNKSFFANAFLLLAVCTYSYMMAVLIKNQKHTLKAIKTEFASQMKRLKHSYSNQYTKIEGIEEELDDRYEHQTRYLNKFYYVLGVLFLSVMVLIITNIPWGELANNSPICSLMSEIWGGLAGQVNNAENETTSGINSEQ